MNVKYETTIHIEGIGFFRKVAKEGILEKYEKVDNKDSIFYTLSADTMMEKMMMSLFQNDEIDIVFASSDVKEALEKPKEKK